MKKRVSPVIDPSAAHAGENTVPVAEGRWQPVFHGQSPEFNRVYAYAPGRGACGQPIPEAHKATLSKTRTRAFGRRGLQQMGVRDPLALTTLGEMNKYLRLALAAHGVEGWGSTGAQWGDIGRITLESLEDVSVQGRPARLHSPLSLRYVLRLPALAAAMFEKPSPPFLTPQLETRFWELAWDYANATEKAWSTGAISGLKYQQQLGMEASELPQQLAQVKQHIADALAARHVDVTRQEWQPEASPYRPFMGQLQHQRWQQARRVVDRSVVPPENLASAEFLGDYVWHLTRQYGSIAGLAAATGMGHDELNRFFGRLTGHSPDPARADQWLSEGAGYNTRLVQQLPELLTYLQQHVPADVLTPYEQARFWCMAEEYAYAGLDCSYDRGSKAIRGVHTFREAADVAVNEVIPRAMACLVSEHPLDSARAAMAMDNELMLSLAKSEVRKNRHAGAGDRQEAPRALDPQRFIRPVGPKQRF